LPLRELFNVVFVLGFIYNYLMIFAYFSQLPQSRERWAKGVPIGSTFFSKDKK